MNKRVQIKTVVLYGVLFFYILLLIKILFLSRISSLEAFNSHYRSINLVPFFSIRDFISGSEIVRRFSFANVVGNIIIFVPLGVYLPLLRKNKKVLINLLYIFTASLLVEVVQWLLNIGSADVDDLILNSLGGLIGILGYKLLLLILRDEKKVSLIVAILSALGLPVILYYLFMIQMRF